MQTATSSGNMEGLKMARRKKGRSRGGSGVTFDMTEAKFFGQLFKAYNGPNTIKRAMNKDLSGAADEWGKGELIETGTQSLTAGFFATVRRKFKMYVQPVKSRFFRLRG